MNFSQFFVMFLNVHWYMRSPKTYHFFKMTCECQLKTYWTWHKKYILFCKFPAIRSWLNINTNKRKHKYLPSNSLCILCSIWCTSIYTCEWLALLSSCLLKTINITWTFSVKIEKILKVPVKYKDTHIYKEHNCVTKLLEQNFWTKLQLFKLKTVFINILQGKCICTVLVTGFLLVPEGTRSKSQSLRGFICHFCCLVAYLTGNILTCILAGDLQKCTICTLH